MITSMRGCHAQWPLTLTYIFKVNQPWICNKTAKIWHVLPCQFCSMYSSGWILSLFGTHDHHHDSFFFIGQRSRPHWVIRIFAVGVRGMLADHRSTPSSSLSQGCNFVVNMISWLQLHNLCNQHVSLSNLLQLHLSLLKYHSWQLWNLICPHLQLT